MSKLRSEQITHPTQAFVPIDGIPVTLADTDITAVLTTALQTAGSGASTVPNKISDTSGNPGTDPVGVVLNGVCIVVDNASRDAIVDGAGNIVFGKIAGTPTAYTLSLYSTIGGTDTPFVPAPGTQIHVEVPYMFDFARLPLNWVTDLMIRLQMVNKPTTAVASNQVIEIVTVTALNTLANLSQTPSNPQELLLYVNGQANDGLANGSFTVAGQAVNWNAAQAGFALDPVDRVVAVYSV